MLSSHNTHCIYTPTCLHTPIDTIHVLTIHRHSCMELLQLLITVYSGGIVRYA